MTQTSTWMIEARVFNDEGFQYEYSIEPTTRTNGQDPYNFVYVGLPETHHVLKKVQNCFYCRAKRFEGEGPAFCCHNGRINIFIPEVPAELRRLFTSQIDRDAKYFRRNIRYFNLHFSFTSMGVFIDRSLETAKGTGIYTFKPHGQIYHKLDQLVLGVKGPRHMQLYFYDTNETVHHRMKRSPHLDANVIRTILNIIQHNPYVQACQSLGTLTNLGCYAIELNTSISVDQRRYNALVMEQVAAIWFDGNDPQQRFERSIIIYGKENQPHYIRPYHVWYDPLAYLVFNPNGETRWGDMKILYQDSPLSKLKRKYTKRAQKGPTLVEINDVSDANVHEEDEISKSQQYVGAREYLCFRLQIREGEFNVMFYSGRLFQQWAVDMYVKVESMCLDWYLKPTYQDLIRADLYQGLLDTLAAGEARASQAGRRIVLSKDFLESDHDVHSRYMDAMALIT